MMVPSYQYFSPKDYLSKRQNALLLYLFLTQRLGPIADIYHISCENADMTGDYIYIAVFDKTAFGVQL